MWEAAMSAAHHKLDNLVLILDRNHLQIEPDKLLRRGKVLIPIKLAFRQLSSILDDRKTKRDTPGQN